MSAELIEQPELEVFRHRVVAAAGGGYQVAADILSCEQRRLEVPAEFMLSTIRAVPAPASEKSLHVVLENTPTHTATIPPTTELYIALGTANQPLAETLSIPKISHATKLILRATELKQAIDDYPEPLDSTVVLVYQCDNTKPGESLGSSETYKRIIMAAGDEVAIDQEARLVSVKDKIVNDLTYTEYEVLRYIASNPGRTLTPREIQIKVWGSSSLPDPNHIYVMIRQIRKKIAALSNGPQPIIETVRGQGYTIS